MNGRPITPDDQVAFADLQDIQVSPDGSSVAFTVGESVTNGTRLMRRQIWVAPLNGGLPRQFTASPRADEAPRWSPDSRTLAFLSDRHADGDLQLYTIDYHGGEARRITNLAASVSSPSWSADGSRIAFLLTDPPTDEDRRREERTGGALEIERFAKWQRLWSVDLTTGTTQQLSTGDWQIWEYDWAADGRCVAVAGTAPYEWSWFTARLVQLPAGGGEPQVIYAHPERQLGCPRFSPDGQQVAFLSAIWSDRGPNGGDVLLLPIGGGEPVNLTEGYRGSVWWLQWGTDGKTLWYLAYEEGEAAFGRIDVPRAQRTTLWRGRWGFSEDYESRYVAANGTLVVARSAATHPFDVWQATPSANGTDLSWQQLTRLHPQMSHLALGEQQVLHWQAPDGLAIQGLLILPVGYQPGQRVPLVTWVHGGPAWLFTQRFYGSTWTVHQAIAGAGMAVFMPNPRGSTGWGVCFTEANIGDFGGRDWGDIQAGIDHVLQLGIADPERLAIAGWSYGGFMAAWATTQTQRFKAAIVGAGITHWRSFHGTAEIGTWDVISLRSSPYQQGATYDRFSPLHYVDRVTTPTLILHGSEDIIVPVGQGYEWFRALKDRGVPVEMAVYPREGHGIRERAHQLDRFWRYIAWLRRYLLEDM